MQGLLNKVDEVNLFNDKFKVDILCVCEHWLAQGEISDIRLHGYNMVSAYCRQSGQRGGVAIYLKSDRVGIEVTYLTELSTQNTCEVAAVHIDELNLTCIEVYRVPLETNFEMFIEVLFNVLSVFNCRNKSNASLMLCGDFNVNILCDDINKQVFLNLLSSFNLKTTINEITRPGLGRGSCLDNITTSIHSDRIVATKVEPMVVSDHFAVILECQLDEPIAVCDNVPREGEKRISIRPIDRINSLYFTILLSKINWLFIYTMFSVDEKFNCFLSSFLNVVELACPVKSVSVKRASSYKPNWYNADLKCLKNQCLFLYEQFKYTGLSCYRDSYNYLKCKYKR